MKAVLTIAGSDSSGGAGIQADLKTIAAHHLFGESVITALTAQNTLGVTDVLEVDPVFVGTQIDAVFDDIRPDAVKIGMVSSSAIVGAIADGLDRHKAANVVVDPVMVATVITPNIPEAEVLSGRAIASSEDVEAAASLIADRCVAVWENASDFTDAAPSVPAILIKGGHGVDEPDAADDYLRMADGESVWLRGTRIANDNTHGTGCSLSSAIACGLARGFSVDVAVRDAKAYVAGALAAGLNLGRGSGPLDHMWQYGTPMPC